MNKAKEIKREQQKMKKVADKLTPNQLKLFDLGVREKVREVTVRYNWAVNAALAEYGIDYTKAEEIMSRVNVIMEEEYKNEVEEFEMAGKLTRESIIESAKKHGLDGVGRKKIAKELGATYTTITTYVSRWKITEDDLKVKAVKTKEQEILESCEPDVREALEEIFPQDEENIEEYSEASRVTVLEKRAEEIIEGAKEVQCTKLAEIEEKEELERDRQALVKMSTLEFEYARIKGNNGRYILCPEGVELQRSNSIMSFENEEQLEEWVNEYRQVLKMASRRNICI